MRPLLLSLACLLLTSSAWAQIPSQNVQPPIFIAPASAVNGGGGFSPQLYGPQSCTVPAYSYTSAQTSGWGFTGTTLCPVVDGVTALTFANPTGADVTSNYVRLVRTIPNTSAQFRGVNLLFTEPVGGVVNGTRAFNVEVAPGGAGTAVMSGISSAMDSNTADQAYAVSGGSSNLTSPGTGTRIGGSFSGDRGDVNYGSISMSYDGTPAFTSTYSIGAIGMTESLGTNSIGVLAVGGVDGHTVWTPPAVSGALVVNQVAAQPIALFQDNGSTVLTVADGGDVTATGVVRAAVLRTDGTVANAGDLRLPNAANVGWRNQSNDGNLLFGLDSSNRTNFAQTGTGSVRIGSTQATDPTCTANCGTDPVVVGTDSEFTVTMGTSGVPASGWVITFNGQWAAAPQCGVFMAKAGMVVGKLPLTMATTTSTLTVVTNGTAPSTTDIYNVICRSGR